MTGSYYCLTEFHTVTISRQNDIVIGMFTLHKVALVGVNLYSKQFSNLDGWRSKLCAKKCKNVKIQTVTTIVTLNIYGRSQFLKNYFYYFLSVRIWEFQNLRIPNSVTDLYIDLYYPFMHDEWWEQYIDLCKMSKSIRNICFCDKHTEEIFYKSHTL